MKAFVLAAGRGTRMQPLTLKQPKPLLEVGGEPLIFRLLKQLSRSGVREVIVNTSYLGEQIHQAIGDGHQFGLKVTFSHEPEGPFETAGGIHYAKHLLGDAPFLCVSGDIWTDFPFETLLQQTSRYAVLAPVGPGGRADFTYADGHVLPLSPNAPGFTYANIAVLDPADFTSPDCLGQSLGVWLKKWANQGVLSGDCYFGEWVNVGTPELLQQLNHEAQSIDG